MQTPPLPENEKDRLEALRALQVLDTGPDQLIDDLTRLAAEVCGTPFALVSLVDENRLWYKSKLGLEVLDSDRHVSLCAYAILENDIFEVCDATLDPRFADSPYVTRQPPMRFYAGAPLTTSSGYNVGTVCVLDSVPHVLSATQRNSMRVLAQSAMRTMEMRKATHALSEAVRAEEEALAQKAWLSAYVSHEVRNQLTVTCGMLELLARTQLDPKQRQFLQAAQQGTDSMRRLVSDVLTLAKARDVKLEIRSEPFELRRLLEGLARQYQPVAAARGLGFEACVDPMLPDLVLGDAERLTQVLHNLIGNSLKFTTQGSIVVRANESADKVRLAVEDTGVGMTAEQLAALFRPYRPGADPKGSGTGLGLYIAHELVRQLGTSIEVQSCVGRGSTFSFALALNPVRVRSGQDPVPPLA